MFPLGKRKAIGLFIGLALVITILMPGLTIVVGAILLVIFALNLADKLRTRFRPRHQPAIDTSWLS